MSNIILGDCLEVMRGFSDNQFDLVLTDPPYGTTAIDWDKEVDFMSEALRVAPTVVMTASQPFTSKVVAEFIKYFKHEWIWVKSAPSNFALAKYAPLKEHENIIVFCRDKLTYNPQMEARKGSGEVRAKHGYKSDTSAGEFIGNFKTTRTQSEYITDKRYPSSVQKFNNRDSERGYHPTQKPVALFKYLIKTYTNKDDSILDPFAGSGTTLRAAKDLGRDCTVIEINPKYVEIIKKRERQEVLL